MKKYLTWALLGTSYLTVFHAQALSASRDLSTPSAQVALGSSSLKEKQRALNEGRARVFNNQSVLNASEGELRDLEKQYFGELVKSVQDGTFNIPQPVSAEIGNLMSTISAKLGQIDGLEGQISSQQAQLMALLEQRKTREAQIQVLQKTIEDTLNSPDQSPTTISVEQRREFEDKLSTAALALDKLTGEIDTLEAEVAGVMDAKRPLDVALDQINNGDKNNPCLPPSVLPTVKSQIERELAGHNQIIQSKNGELSRKVIEREGLEKSKERTMALEVEAKEKAVLDARLGHEEKVAKMIGELETLVDGLAQNRNQENVIRVKLSGIESQIDGLRAELELLGGRLHTAILAQSATSSAEGMATEVEVTAPSVITIPTSGGSVTPAGATTPRTSTVTVPTATNNPPAVTAAPAAAPSVITIPASGGSVTPATVQPKRSYADVLKSAPSASAQQPKAATIATSPASKAPAITNKPGPAATNKRGGTTPAPLGKR